MFKIDTKDSFSIFHLSEEEITENMSDNLKNALAKNRNEKPGNLILTLPEEGSPSPSFIEDVKRIQADYLKENLSFILAPVPAEREKRFSAIRELNHTPTLKEAIDMLMMEVLERDLLGPDSAS